MVSKAIGPGALGRVTGVTWRELGALIPGERVQRVLTGDLLLIVSKFTEVREGVEIDPSWVVLTEGGQVGWLWASEIILRLSKDSK